MLCVTVIQLMSSYMHGAVIVGDYMVVIGGVGLSGSAVVQLSLYDIACNHCTHIAHLSAGKLSPTSVISFWEGNFFLYSYPSLCLSISLVVFLVFFR